MAVEESVHWKNTQAGVCLAFAILATIAYVLRLYARWISSVALKIEDYLMFAALILAHASTASAVLMAYNGIGIPGDRLEADRAFRLNLGSWLIQKFWAGSMGFAKASIIIFFKRLFGVHRGINMLLNGLMLFVVAWAIQNIIVSTLFCRPVQYYYDKSIEGGTCMSFNKIKIQATITAVLALVQDVIILSIPVPSLWRLQMKRRKKIAVAVILCCGCVTCVISLLRVVEFERFNVKMLSATAIYETLWTLLENDLTIICGCMPMMKPIMASFLGSRSGAHYNPNRPSGSIFRARSSGNTNSGKARSGGSNKRHQPWNSVGLSTFSGVDTTVTGPAEANPERWRAGSDTENDRNSSEVELNRIAVHTIVTRNVEGAAVEAGGVEPSAVETEVVPERQDV